MYVLGMRSVDNRHSRQLREFSSVARQLGGSVAILLSAHNLRVRLSRILHLFRVNAAEVFPLHVDPQPLHFSRASQKQDRLPERWYRRSPWLYHNPIIPVRLELNEFPRELRGFRSELKTFLECLNEFPEAVDDIINSNISLLVDDLKVRPTTLGSGIRA